MLENLEEKKRIEILAKYDFLDVCLLGETGTGKTHTARLIHDLSPRSDKPFVAVNCAELTPTIIEAELFGYEKGAFTGAINSKEGKFEAAEGGTLLLDEIGELPAHLQAKLLKVVEDKQVTRVGGNRQRVVDVRLIYATHRNLGVFREDLRYRIATHTIHLKPLRERRAEIIPLARLFLSEFNSKSGRIVAAKDETLQLLEKAEWRGNVRELRAVLEKACLDALFVGIGDERQPSGAVELNKTILLSRLSSQNYSSTQPKIYAPDAMASDDYSPPSFIPGGNLEKYLQTVEAELLRRALATHNNNQSRAARQLGISRSGLIKKLKRLCH